MDKPLIVNEIYIKKTLEYSNLLKGFFYNFGSTANILEHRTIKTHI